MGARNTDRLPRPEVKNPIDDDTDDDNIDDNFQVDGDRDDGAVVALGEEEVEQNNQLIERMEREGRSGQEIMAALRELAEIRRRQRGARQ